MQSEAFILTSSKEHFKLHALLREDSTERYHLVCMLAYCDVVAKGNLFDEWHKPCQHCTQLIGISLGVGRNADSQDEDNKGRVTDTQIEDIKNKNYNL